MQGIRFPQRTHAKTKHAGREPITADRRREIAWALRIDDGLSLSAIVARLRKDHDIDVSTATVSRDLERARSNAAKTFGPHFNPVAKVAEYVSRYESIAARAVRASGNVKDSTQIASLLKVAGGAYQRAMALMPDVGLVPRDLGVLRVEDPDKSERIPSGLELQKLWDSVNVSEAELISEAELAWTHGDAVAAEAAARDARDSARDVGDPRHNGDGQAH